jgi:uncharacterized metal-binding protein
MGLWIVPLLLYFTEIPKWDLFWYPLWAFAGLSVANLVHIVADFLKSD